MALKGYVFRRMQVKFGVFFGFFQLCFLFLFFLSDTFLKKRDNNEERSDKDREMSFVHQVFDLASTVH